MRYSNSLRYVNTLPFAREEEQEIDDAQKALYMFHMAAEREKSVRTAKMLVSSILLAVAFYAAIYLVVVHMVKHG